MVCLAVINPDHQLATMKKSKLVLLFFFFNCQHETQAGKNLPQKHSKILPFKTQRVCAPAAIENWATAPLKVECTKEQNVSHYPQRHRPGVVEE